MDERQLDEATEKVLEICKKQLPQQGALHPDLSLVRDLGLDSLQALELVSEIESSFSVSIPSELLPEIDTIRDVARIVMRVKLGSS